MTKESITSRETSSMEFLQPLVRKKVTLRTSYDMATIAADDGWEVHIYNRFRLSGERGPMEFSELPDHLCLEHLQLIEMMLVFSFSDDVTLTVDLSDAGYSGPEAMQAVRPDGSIVIWTGLA